MKFEWDPNKAAINLVKHGISFDRATRVFLDPMHYSIPDKRHDYGEERTNTTGRVDNLLIATITHTDRNGTTRIISARLATSKERKKYHV
jgi:uncharacterized DUF497 family protein